MNYIFKEGGAQVGGQSGHADPPAPVASTHGGGAKRLGWHIVGWVEGARGVWVREHGRHCSPGGGHLGGAT